jgi:hypothetical protein
LLGFGGIEGPRQAIRAANRTCPLRLAALLAVVSCLAAAQPVLAGEVTGKVFNARGQAVAGVALELAGQQAVTAADGSFTFAEVAEGEHTVVAGSQAVAVSVPAEGAVRRNVFLLSAAARQRVTGDVAVPADSEQVFAASARMAARLLAEGEARQTRRAADITG